MQMMAGVLGVSLRWLMTGEGGPEEAPPTGGPLPEKTRALLDDLARMRVEVLALAGRMGEVEGRLRAKIGAGTR
jgi:hypothetical protein